MNLGNASSDVDTYDRMLVIVWSGAAFGLLMVIVGIVGELLGWWNDVGEVLVTAGTPTSLLLGSLGLLMGAGRGQARTIGASVVDNGRKLDRLETMDRKLDQLAKLEKLDELDKLEKLDELDIIQVKLDKQTGVLDRQLGVLVEMRDDLRRSVGNG